MLLRSIVFGVILLVSSVCCVAQIPTGSISGTVSDPTGAAIPGAAITLTNDATGARRSAVSNDSGLYSLPSLSPATYTLSVEAKGFKVETQKNIEVQVGESARLDFSMQVGNTSETIEVSGGAPVLETENATIGTVIENRRIVDLPLNGRNYLQLASLTPGVTTNGPASSQGQQRMGGARNAFALNVSGQRTSFNHYSLDGIENTDPNFNTYLFLPSIDALQEFKVESGTYGVEYGRGLSQVNATTKSGTNEFHGVLFEFLRNSDLDAKNFFDSHTLPIPPFKRNQFGATIGGPILIPKVFDGRNKLFFFFDYEGLRERKALTQTFSMPLAQDRTGNFTGSSAIVYDPLTRVVNAAGQIVSQTAFAGNVIPPSRIQSISTTLYKNYFPLPNAGVPGSYVNNYISNEGRKSDGDQYTSRVDYVLNSANSFQFRYSRGEDTQYLPLTTPGLGYNNQVNVDQGVLSYILVLGGNKVNEFKFGINILVASNSQGSANKNNVVAQLGIGGIQTDIPAYWGVPVVQFGAGLSTVGECSDCPFVNYDTTFQWTDNFVWTKGKHIFKFGTDDRRMRFDQIGAVVPRGRFTFNGTYTADPAAATAPQNAIADFLLGYMQTSEGQTGAPVANFRGYSLNFYAQDTYKITPKFTLTYGLRYELEPPYLDKHDNIVNIDFHWANDLLPVYVRAGTGDPFENNPPFALPSTVPYVRDGRFGRRAYRTSFKDFAPRIGLAYSLDSKTVLRAGAGIYYIREIGNAQFDLVRNAPFTIRRNENAQSSLIPSLNWQAPFVQNGAPTFILANQFDQQPPNIPQWSVGIQRQLSATSSLELNYIGSAGIHLQRLQTYNTAAPGPPTNINNRRPWYPIYTGGFQVMNASSHSSYDAFQARFQQRFNRGFTLLSSYSWSKSIDNGSGIRTVDGDSLTPANDYNLSGERGLSAFDFRHRWTTSFLYELPIGKGHALLGNVNGFVNAILGGWQTGAIATLQSGFPFTLYCGSGTIQNGGDNCYPDGLGGVSSLPSDQRGPSKWFNTANFVNRINDPTLPQYRYGNNGRNNIIGPPLVNVDFSLVKNFRFSEKRGLEFRSEFFNLMNHPIFGQPNTTISNSFGTIGSTRIDSRQIQFALKLNY
jgi:Carboxypeptidase regulatory-like domain